jgi:hypothetical protein
MSAEGDEDAFHKRTALDAEGRQEKRLKCGGQNENQMNIPSAQSKSLWCGEELLCKGCPNDA